MSKVTYIHGIPTDEIQDRAREIPREQPLDYTVMTEGEVKLSLLREQLEILSSFYPEVKDYRAGLRAIDETLEKGLHATAQINGFNPGIARYAIGKARGLYQPAVNVDRLAGLHGIEDECATERSAFQAAMGQYIRASFWNKAKRRKEMQSELDKLNQCLGLLDFQKVLNDHLEGSSHHLLYNYVANANAVPNVVSAKSINHRIAIENLARTSGLSLENVATWVRNGVMRNNAKNGTEPFQPEKTIEIMQTEIPAQEAVSGAFLVALPIILKALAAAVSATALMLAQMKQTQRQQFTSNLQGIGNASFGPEENDWFTGAGSGAGAGNDNTILILGLAAAGYFALK